ncbi:DUF2842 domain-containing protein [Algicella marina]|uniref:DUF2842 domain-containing protein n=1 Tax=Algicella marina TaxID=2683284 RepID=A0A6P1T0P1_9RHOB|nr:DUF2842 domain-containing protein [Algicella marina]QHQ35006.1 DUF2842 domain-containing protein [Algicella marina]
MALSYRARRRWSLIALLVWLPLYIVVVVNLVELLDRPNILVELLVYVVLGVLWALPLRQIFLGVGRAAPDEGDNDHSEHHMHPDNQEK